MAKNSTSIPAGSYKEIDRAENMAELIATRGVQIGKVGLCRLAYFHPAVKHQDEGAVYADGDVAWAQWLVVKT